MFSLKKVYSSSRLNPFNCSSADVAVSVLMHSKVQQEVRRKDAQNSNWYVTVIDKYGYKQHVDKQFAKVLTFKTKIYFKHHFLY